MKKMYIIKQFILVMSFMLFFNNIHAQTTTLTVGGKSRTLFVYAPTGIAQNRPLVISLHGLNQDINYQKNQAKWELVADTAKFVVVYPGGENNSWDINGTKDTDFILAIIESMVTRFGIDRNRVYVSGFSMGGMMSYHTANKIADKVAAIGPVSGYLFGNTTASSRPMPIIHVHGTADDVVYYNASGNQQGVKAMLQKWRDWNKCPSTSTFIKPYPAGKNNANSYEYWGPCDRSAVALISLDGKGHWHSNDAAGVHTTIELWNFLKKFSLGSTNTAAVAITSPAANATFTAPATITLNATASKTGGSITKVEFYNGTTKLGEDATAPYSYSWTNVAAGTYSITAVATDNSNVKTTSTAVSIKVNVPQGPYNNNANLIPGTIQVEEYDLGGSGVAYSDDSPGSAVTPTVNYRTTEDVDIETCTDAGGGYNLGFATAGEWLEYTVNVAASGNYKLDLRVACNGDGRTVAFTMDGTSIANNIAIPNTGGWQTWTTTSVNNVPLTAGQHVLRMTIGTTSYVNINYLNFSIVTGLEESTLQNKLTVFPNPFENNININLSDAYNYKILDLSGRILLQGQAEGETQIGDAIPKGVYLLDIQSVAGSKKLIVQKK